MTKVHVRLHEWQSAGVELPELRGLDLGEKTARELAARLKKAGIIEVTELREGLHVRALAHVGRIQIGEVVVTIEPKLGASELLELVRYAYGLRNLLTFERTGFSHAGMIFQDLLAAQLLSEASELVRRGLAKTYVQRSELLGSPRGRIDFSAVARSGPTQVAELRCRHHVRSGDHHLNRVLRAGVALAGYIAREPTLRRSLRAMDARLSSEIGEIDLTVASLARARRELTRLTSAYTPALQLIELLYASAAISLDGESTIALPGFLFDMNRFFQSLIGRFLAENLPGYAVREEDALTDMMRYVPGLNPRRRRSPRPRPDFVIAKGTSPHTLLDAKYRDLWERELPREMLYQLAIYALSQPRPSTASILFPTTNTDASSAVVELSDPAGLSALGYVELRPVILPVLLRALDSGSQREREELAHKLAFGKPRHDVPERVSAGAL